MENGTMISIRIVFIAIIPIMWTIYVAASKMKDALADVIKWFFGRIYTHNTHWYNLYQCVFQN